MDGKFAAKNIISLIINSFFLMRLVLIDSSLLILCYDATASSDSAAFEAVTDII